MSEAVNQPVVMMSQPKITVSEKSVAFHTNIIGMGISPEECVLNFGLVDIDNPEKADSVARIYMSIPHAKRLAKSLAAALDQYEVAFGVIKDNPEDMLTPETRKQMGLNDK